jgi:pimeloyl-ACP methyl ester carboxylesterase
VSAEAPWPRAASGRRLGRRRTVLLALGAACIVAALVFRSWLAAEARAVVVLASISRTPVLTWVVDGLTRTPHVEEANVAGRPATVVRPGGHGPWPALIFVNGLTPLGRFHPKVEALARGLARAGYLVVVPDLPGLRRAEVTERTLAATIAVTRAVARRSDVRHGRVGLIGVSAGASLALLSAERPGVAERVSLVAGIAPYADLRDVLRLATTGVYAENGRLVGYEADRFLLLATARTLIANLPPGDDRSRLLAALPGNGSGARNPLAGIAADGAELRPAARAALALLRNRVPRRFDRLYARLPADVRAAIRHLSPIAGVSRLRARVELVSSPHDAYFPLAEPRRLVAADPDVHLTVTRSLDHALPRLSLRDVRDLFRFDGFMVRSLRAASAS